MLTRCLFNTISLLFILKTFKCEKIACPTAEFITGVHKNEITGVWYSKQTITLEGEPQDTIIESDDCVAIKIGDYNNAKMRFTFHALNLNTSSTDLKVGFGTFLTITQEKEERFKAEVFSNFTEDATSSNNDEDEPDFYIYIMSVVAEKYLVLMQCETVGNASHVSSATIFTRRTSDSKPTISDEELNLLSQVIPEKIQAQVNKRLNFNIDCFNNERNYHW